MGNTNGDTVDNITKQESINSIEKECAIKADSKQGTVEVDEHSDDVKEKKKGRGKKGSPQNKCKTNMVKDNDDDKEPKSRQAKGTRSKKQLQEHLATEIEISTTNQGSQEMLDALSINDKSDEGQQNTSKSVKSNLKRKNLDDQPLQEVKKKKSESTDQAAKKPRRGKGNIT